MFQIQTFVSKESQATGKNDDHKFLLIHTPSHPYAYYHCNTFRCPTPGQKPMCDLSGLTVGNYKEFTKQVSQGKTALPTSDLMNSQCIIVYEGSYSKGPKPRRSGMFLHMAAFPAQLPPFRVVLSGAFHWHLPQALFFMAENYLWGEEGNLKILFPLLWLSTFLLLALSLLPPGSHQVHKTAGSFCLRQWDQPHICALHLTLSWC